MKKELIKDYIKNIQDILNQQEKSNNDLWNKENITRADHKYCLGKNACLRTLNSILYEIEDIEDENELNGFLDTFKIMLEYTNKMLGK